MDTTRPFLGLFIAVMIGNQGVLAGNPDSLARPTYRSITLHQIHLSSIPARSIPDILNTSVPSVYLYGERWPDYWRNHLGYQNTSVPSPYQKRMFYLPISRGQTTRDLGFEFGAIPINDCFSGNSILVPPYHAIQSIEIANYGLSAGDAGYSAGMVKLKAIEPTDRWRFMGEAISDVAAPVLGAYRYGHTTYAGSVTGPVTPMIGVAVAAQVSLKDDASPGILGHPRIEILRDRGVGRPDTAYIGALTKGPRPVDINAADESSIYGALHFRPVEKLHVKVEHLWMHATRNIFTPEYLLSGIRVPRTEQGTSFTLAEMKFQVNERLVVGLGGGYHMSRAVLTERSLASKGNDAVLLFQDRIRGGTGSTTYYGDNLLYDIDRGFVGYQQTEMSSWILNAEAVWTIAFWHQLKTNISYRQFEVRNFSLYDPGRPVGGANDFYGYSPDTSGQNFRLKERDGGLDGAKTPVLSHWAVSDHLQFHYVQVELGLRLDHWNSGTKRLNEPGNPAGPDFILNADDFGKTTTKLYWSPRAAVSVFYGEFRMHGDIGWYLRPPTFEDTYIGTALLERMSLLPPFSLVVANSTLRAQQVFGWGIGGTQDYSAFGWPIDKLHAGLYYYGRSTRHGFQRSAISSFPNGLITVTNSGRQDVKGLEADLRATTFRHFTIGGMGEYRVSQLQYSWENSGFRAAWLGFSNVKFETKPDHFMSWDAKAWGEIAFGSKEGPKVLGHSVLEESSLTVIMIWNSRLRFTPTEATRLALAGVPAPRVIGRRNSAKTNLTEVTNLKVTKAFRAAGRLKITAFIEVLNLFNKKNVLDVFTATGAPVYDGYDFTTLPPRQAVQYAYLMLDNYHYSPPRMVNLGARVDF